MLLNILNQPDHAAAVGYHLEFRFYGRSGLLECLGGFAIPFQDSFAFIELRMVFARS